MTEQWMDISPTAILSSKAASKGTVSSESGESLKAYRLNAMDD